MIYGASASICTYLLTLLRTSIVASSCSFVEPKTCTLKAPIFSPLAVHNAAQATNTPNDCIAWVSITLTVGRFLRRSIYINYLRQLPAFYPIKYVVMETSFVFLHRLYLYNSKQIRHLCSFPPPPPLPAST